MNGLGYIVNVPGGDAAHVYPSAGQQEDVVLVSEVLGLFS